MVAQKYRWDFIGLSSQVKPTPATSNKVVDGSTFYESDTSKLYVFCKGAWYERKPLGGGGSGGTDDFEQLTNRPKYNGVTMSGDTNIPEVVSYSDFTGATSETAGTNGLVPAPTTSDVNKFLKGDGTWDTAGSSYTLPIASDSELGGIKVGSNLTINSSTGVLDATDTTYSAFTGTDGTSAGAAGLVPAPATTDAGKFLKADGTWGEAGGGVITLTTEDYNYPETGTKTAIEMSLFNGGYYIAGEGLTIRFGNSNLSISTGDIIIKNRNGSSNSSLLVYRASYDKFVFWKYNGSTEALIDTGGVINNLTSSSATYPLSANQGRILNNNIGTLSSLTTTAKTSTVAAINELNTLETLSTTPTGTTAGIPGRLYSYDSGGGTYEIWLCVHDNGDNTYVWKQLSLI